MKELTIEEKAKRYEKALERMKSWVRGEHPECFTEAKKAAEFIFPELKESEDEKIRKVLVGWFKRYKEQDTCGSEMFNGIPTDNILTWLEKQVEQKSAWSEEDEQIILSIEQAMNCASLLNIVPEKMDKIRTWLKSLKNRVY